MKSGKKNAADQSRDPISKSKDSAYNQRDATYNQSQQDGDYVGKSFEHSRKGSEYDNPQGSFNAESRKTGGSQSNSSSYPESGKNVGYQEQNTHHKDPSSPGGQKTPGTVNFAGSAGAGAGAGQQNPNYKGGAQNSPNYNQGSPGQTANQNQGAAAQQGSGSNKAANYAEEKMRSGTGKDHDANRNSEVYDNFEKIRDAVGRKQTPLNCNFDMKGDSAKAIVNCLEKAGYKRDDVMKNADPKYSTWARK